MADSYENVIGLEPLSGNHRHGILFFHIAKSFGGHTSVLALFRRAPGRPDLHPTGTGAPESGAKSSLHHIALPQPIAEQDAAMAWLNKIGQPHRVQTSGWIGWRGIFIADPKGITVELVRYDASLKD